MNFETFNNRVKNSNARISADMADDAVVVESRPATQKPRRNLKARAGQALRTTWRHRIGIAVVAAGTVAGFFGVRQVINMAFQAGVRSVTEAKD